MKNLKIAKNKTQTNGAFFSDIDINYVNPQEDSTIGDEKENEQKQNEENYEWIVAIMSIDDFSSVVFSKNNDKQALQLEINEVEKEMYHNANKSC